MGRKFFQCLFMLNPSSEITIYAWLATHEKVDTYDPIQRKMANLFVYVLDD